MRECGHAQLARHLVRAGEQAGAKAPLSALHRPRCAETCPPSYHSNHRQRHRSSVGPPHRSADGLLFTSPVMPAAGSVSKYWWRRAPTWICRRGSSCMKEKSTSDLRCSGMIQTADRSLWLRLRHCLRITTERRRCTLPSGQSHSSARESSFPLARARTSTTASGCVRLRVGLQRLRTWFGVICRLAARFNSQGPPRRSSSVTRESLCVHFIIHPQLAPLRERAARDSDHSSAQEPSVDWCTSVAYFAFWRYLPELARCIMNPPPHIQVGGRCLSCPRPPCLSCPCPARVQPSPFTAPSRLAVA